MLGPLLAAALVAAGPPLLPARFVLQGAGRLDARPLPSRDEKFEALALVAPGSAPGELAIQLRSWGFSCDLRARVARNGALQLAAGQTCRLEVDSDDAHGTVDAKLTSGSGRLDARELSLVLAWELGGMLRTRVIVPGAADLAAWTPDVPVHGTAKGSSRGPRDEAGSAAGGAAEPPTRAGP